MDETLAEAYLQRCVAERTAQIPSAATSEQRATAFLIMRSYLMGVVDALDAVGALDVDRGQAVVQAGLAPMEAQLVAAGAIESIDVLIEAEGAVGLEADPARAAEILRGEGLPLTGEVVPVSVDEHVGGVVARARGRTKHSEITFDAVPLEHLDLSDLRCGDINPGPDPFRAELAGFILTFRPLGDPEATKAEVLEARRLLRRLWGPDR